METRTFPVEGLSCASCVSRVEKALSQVPGVRRASVNLARNEATVAFEGATPEQLAEAVEAKGYRLLLEAPVAEDHEARGLARRAALAWLLTLPLLLPMLGLPLHLDWRIQALLAGLAAFGAGSLFFRHAATQALHGDASMDTLVALGAGVSWLFGCAEGLRGSHHLSFESAAALTAFLLLGKALELRARRRAAASLEALLALAPATALRLREGQEEEVPVAELRAGDRVRVKPGSAVPVDGVVLSGAADLDEALLTGEPLPVPKAAGDAVIAGAVAHGGALELEVRAAGRDTWLAKLAAQVAEAQGSKAPVQALADRVSAVFVPVILVLAILSFAGWWLHTGAASAAWRPAVTLLVIACPCALGLATPVALSTALGSAARAGLLVRDAAAFERLGRLTDLAFDKTGTLTEGRPSLKEIRGTWTLDEPELLRFAAALEQGSEHPLAQGLCRAASGPLPEVEGFRAHPGGGVSGRVEGRPLRLGSAAFLGLPFPEVEGEGSLVGLADGLTLLGVFRLEDTPRAEAAATIAELKAMGLELHLWSGDRPEAARSLGAQLGIADAEGGLRPEAKRSRIQALQAQGRMVGFAGDGVNDAPALAQADAGLSLPGLEATRGAAPLNLLRPGLGPLLSGLRLARRSRAVIRQNLAWAFGYNLLLVPLAAFGQLERFGGPMLAGAAMGLSSLSVVLNALRLRRVD